MTNPLRRLVLGPGRFPDDLRDELLEERPEVLEEGLPATITFRDYRAPGTRYVLRKQGATAALALTRDRLVVFRTGGVKEIDVPVSSRAVSASLDRPDRLCLAYDAGFFHKNRSGRVEVRLTTASAGRVASRLR